MLPQAPDSGRLWHQLHQEENGILADKRTFGILIDACAKRGDLDTADFWLQRVELAGRQAKLVKQSASEFSECCNSYVTVM